MTVTGHVLNPDGQPLSGVSIQVKGSKRGTLSGSDGRFTLEAAPGDVLQLTSVGYQQKEYIIGREASFTIVLVVATNELDAIQVQAYGVTSKRFTTSNIASVRAEEIEKQPVSNPLLALQGKVPGLMITPASGIAGDRITVRIQGINSSRGGNQPFFVVDGVPFNSTLLQPSTEVNSVWRQTSGTPALGESGTGGSPLNYINPADIESIEVLKDADATAIYGSRAANGAIIITTKKGKSGPLQVDLNLRSGFTEMPRQLNYMDLEEYLAMRLESKRNSNEPLYDTDYDLNGFWGYKVNNNLQDYFFGNRVAYHDLQAAVNGGNGNSNYRVNLGYIRQNSIYGADNNDQKISMGFNLNTASLNRRFKMSLAVNGMVDRNKLPVTDLTGILLELPPNAPVFFNADGSYNWAVDANGFATWGNPLATLEQKNTSQINNLVANLQLSYELLKGLNISSSFGYNQMGMEAVRINPLSGYEPFVQNYPSSREGWFSSSSSLSYNIEPQLSYSGRVLGFKLDWLLGSTVQHAASNAKAIRGSNAPSDDLMENLASFASVSAERSLSNTYRYNALFSRLSLNHNNELLLNLTMRRDGSSRFGPENRFENFGAIGMGWIFTERDWLKEHLALLSFGKLRASYGTTGNDQIGDYTYLDLYGASNINIPYQGGAGLLQTAVYNPLLEWERTNKLNLGLDLGFFKDRLTFSVNYALNRSSNLLQRVNIPYSAGIANNVWTNFYGTVENRNLEFTINSENLRLANFRWSTSLNLTKARNTLVSLDDITKIWSLSGNLVVGESINSTRVYRYMGVDPLTGSIRFADQNGSPSASIDDTKDFTGIVDLNPRFYGGMSNEFSWKTLSLSIQANVVRQNAPSYVANVSNSAIIGYILKNEPSVALSRWHAPGDVAILNKYGMPDYYNGSIAYSDKGYEDATYIRINNLVLGYQLPAKWLNGSGFRQVSFNLQAQNLWTISNYSGLDPETGRSALPQPRTIVAYLKIGF